MPFTAKARTITRPDIDYNREAWQARRNEVANDVAQYIITATDGETIMIISALGKTLLAFMAASGMDKDDLVTTINALCREGVRNLERAGRS